jgi:hypothetical protein
MTSERVPRTYSAALDAVVTGYRDHLRRQLADHDDQRTTFVDDLLTGRADPGHLAERANRYGICLVGHPRRCYGGWPGTPGTVVLDTAATLASRYGAGNTLTTHRDGKLVCISTGGLCGLPAELAHHLLTRLGAGNWQIAVGRAHPGMTGIATSWTKPTATPWESGPGTRPAFANEPR